jgi:uncharacterized protein YceK
MITINTIRAGVCAAGLSLVVLFFALVVGSGCGTTVTVDNQGGGTETIIGKVISPDTTTAAGTLVYLVPQHYIPGVDSPLSGESIDTTRDDGTYTFRAIEPAIYNIQAIRPLSGASVLRRGVDMQGAEVHYYAGTDTLKPPEELSVALPTNPGDTLANVYAVGTINHQLVSTNAGYTVIKGLPAGCSDLVYYTALNGPPQPQPLQTPITLIDDFDDGDALPALHAIDTNVTWEVFDDSKENGNSIVLPAGIVDDFARGLTTAGAFRGASFHATFIPVKGVVTYCGLTIHFAEMFGDTTAGFDFSTLESISFTVRGKGSFYVTFFSRGATDPYPKTHVWGQLRKKVQCPAEWTRVTLLPRDLLPRTGSPQEQDSLRWDDVKTAIYQINFSSTDVPGDTNDVWLDEIVLKGLRDDVFDQ